MALMEYQCGLLALVRMGLRSYAGSVFMLFPSCAFRSSFPCITVRANSASEVVLLAYAV